MIPISTSHSSRWFISLLIPVTMQFACARNLKAPAPSVSFDHQYTAWGRVLARCAADGGFHYGLLKQDSGDLEKAMAEIGAVTSPAFDGFSRDQRFAFLINAHNMFAVRRIVRDYPVKSMGRTSWIGSPLRRRDIRLLGRRWSLLSLRAAILEGDYYDVRALFVLNWGMKGCPPLPPSPVTAPNLNELLERRTADFIRDPRFGKYDPVNRRFHASRLIKDYAPLIERDYGTQWGFLRHFADPKDVNQITLFEPKFKWMKFDRSLNDASDLPPPPRPAHEASGKMK
ncbi:DUF547 domain-containing protein [Candidatus Sumerlaeota bacterium]|nr:DUF547 domain-containing protein [Candidatus Sumerlaeota bacterium]